MVKQPCVLLKILPLLIDWAKQTHEYLFVDMLIDCLAVWEQLAVDDRLASEECDQDNFDLWILTVVLSLASATSESFTESSGIWSPGGTWRSTTLPIMSASVSRPLVMSWQACLRWSFPNHTRNFKFVCCSVLICRTTWNRGCVYKIM